MLSLDQLKQAITALDEGQYETLKQWLADEDFRRWDKQIEADAESGRLDKIIREVTDEYKAGNSSEL